MLIGSIRKELLTAARRGKRFVRWLLGQELLQGAQVDIPTEQLGSDYGGWTVASGFLDDDSTVYSFGVGRDISFDLDLIGRYELVVHAFDPTPRSIRWLEQQTLPEEFISHSLGISDRDGTAVFHPPEREDYVSYTSLDERASNGTEIEAEVRRLQTIMNDLEHESVDLLKMDIEGAEYDVIDDILETQIYPTQLLIEFHHRFSAVSLQQTKGAIKRLNRAGYRIFYVSPTGREYSFLRSVSP